MERGRVPGRDGKLIAFGKARAPALAVAAGVLSFTGEARAAAHVLAVSGQTRISMVDVTTPAVESYDPQADLWTARAPLPAARFDLAGARLILGGAAGMLVAGGSTSSVAFAEALADFYDPTTDTWTPKTPMGTARYGASASPCTIGGIAGVLVLGGSTCMGNCAVNLAEFYDPAANAWTTKAPMPSSRYHLSAAPVTYQGVAGVLAVGGLLLGGQVANAAEFYNPQTDAWQTVAPAGIVRWGPAASPLLVGGTPGVVAAAGQAGAANSNAAEFFNPVSNSWTALAAMANARYGPAAGEVTVAGVDGVLVVGGQQGSSPTGAVEFYNPVANAWTARASMPTTRRWLAAAPVVFGTLTPTRTSTATPTAIPPVSATATHTVPPGVTWTPTSGGTSAASATASATPSPTPTAATPVSSVSGSPTQSSAGSPTATAVNSPPATGSPQPCPTETATQSRTPTSPCGAPYPNPMARTHPAAVFIPLCGKESVRVRVHSASGELVRQLPPDAVFPDRGIAVWDARTSGGGRASAGVYVITVGDAGRTIRHAVALLD